MFTQPKLKKIVAAVAREQGGNLVDLAQIECDVRVAILLGAIDEVWVGLERCDFDPTLVEIADRLLPRLEHTLLEEIIQQPISTREQHARLAAHRAARNVKKVRGAK
jgi:hypothetical protein